MSLPNTAVRRPVTMLMVFCGMIIVGLVSLQRLPTELMPNTSFGEISIIVEVRGGIPSTEVENLVSKPIEEAVGTVTHLKNIISISKEGESRVVLEFEPGTNMDFAALETREKFSQVRNKLPKEIEEPIIAKYEQSDVPVLILAVTGQGRTPEDLRKIVDDTIKEPLQRVNGVARVEIGGGRERKILVEADQAKLQSFAIPLDSVTNTLSVNNLNVLSGDIERKKDKYIIRALGQFKSLSEIENLGIATTPQGAIIRLKDVADVKDSYLEATSFARVNVRPVVSLYIQKETTANTIAVVNDIMGELSKVKKKVPQDILIVATSNQAEFILKAIATVRDSLLWGAGLAVLVLLLFLREWRSALIIALTIPLSVLITFGFMFFQKITLNVMTLSGLALGIGMLVDNSIVVIENISHRREKVIAEGNSTRLKDRAGVAGLVTDASSEMLLAIVASTLTTVIVFLPLVFVNEEIKLMYSGIAWTVTYSLLASLFVALTLVPLMASREYEAIYRRLDKKRLFKKPFFEMIKDFYRGILRAAVRLRYPLFAAGLALFAVSVIVLRTLEVEFIGTTEPSKFTIFIEVPTGAKLDVSDKTVKQVEEILKKVPEIETISSRIEKWSSRVYVNVVAPEKRTRSVAEIINSARPEVEKIQPAFIYFEEAEAVGTKEVFLELFGHDYEVMKNLAITIAQRLQQVRGFTDVKIRMRAGRPELSFEIDKYRSALFGLSVMDIAGMLHQQIRGLRATIYHTEAKEVETVTRLDKKFRSTQEQIRRLTLVTPKGEQIYLEQVADVKMTTGPSEIWRKNKNRMIQVSANRGKIALGTAVDKSREAIKDVKFPKDYFYKVGGDYEKLIENQKQLSVSLIITLVLIFLVLASLFESYYQPFIILVSVPLAAIGVAAALKAGRRPINIGVLIGAIMLGGIVVNNAIILIDHINSLRRRAVSLKDAVIAASEDRLRPILMTAGTTILGLVPMALDKSEAASLWAPLAITVISGLVTSTILTLFFVPSTYIIFEDVKGMFRKRAPEHQSPAHQ